MLGQNEVQNIPSILSRDRVIGLKGGKIFLNDGQKSGPFFRCLEAD